MSLGIPLIVCLIGLVVYALTTNAKVAALSLDCFWVGLLVFLLRYAGPLLTR